MTSLPADRDTLPLPSPSPRSALADAATAAPARAEHGAGAADGARSLGELSAGDLGVGERSRGPALATRLAPLLPALAFAASGVVLAAHQPAETASETGYLAWLGGWTLAGSALLAPVRSRLVPLGALLATLALWVLPFGPTRGAALGVVLVVALMVAGWERLHAERFFDLRDRRRAGARPAPTPGGDQRPALDLLAAVGGALAVHALLRAGELLPANLGLAPLGFAPGAPSLPPAATLAALARAIGPPLLAGGGLALLARRHPAPRVMTAGMAVVVAAGGLTVTAALPLLALAAADTWPWRRDDDQPGAVPSDPGATPNLAARIARGLVPRGLPGAAAALVALALTAMRPAAGVLALAAAVTARLPLRWAWLVAAAPLGWALASGTDAGAGESARLSAVAGLPALLPFAFVAVAREAPAVTGLRTILPALLLGAAGVLLLPPPAGLAAAAALLCVELETHVPGDQGRRAPRTRDAGAGLALQHGWLAFLLAGGALAASYPWLRPVPLDAALAIVGLPPTAAGRVGAASATALATLAGATALLLAARYASLRRTVFLLVVGLATATLVALPLAPLEVAPPEGVDLTATASQWTTRLEGPVRQIRLISTLGEAASLPAGTPVASLSLERAGRPLAAWTLRAGHDTAEWAADRPDLGGSAPRATPWWSWVPPPGTFFAHAYAATWRPARPLAATRVRVTREPALPPGVTVSLLRVEVTP